MEKRLKVLDLFCGAGGLSEGFKQAGFEIVLGIDNDKDALETFKLNHPESKTFCGDISKLTKKEIRNIIGDIEIDMIIGGPPCQGFSMAGRRDPGDSRNTLIEQYLNLVSQINPKLFVIENVRGLLSMKTKKGESVIGNIIKLAENKGYFITICPLNAADYGVPQKRKRVFLIGSKKKDFKIVPREQKRIPVKNILIKKEDVPKNYFYSEKLINGFKRREEKNKKLGRGFGWQFLDLNEPSYTISARYYKDGCDALVKYSDTEIRKLTPGECASIQSFPKDFKFASGKIKTYKQIGNAVPPKLAYAVAKSIKSTMSLNFDG
jgi:DNA (cytosine-5)-methyltransferase 1